MMPTPEQLEFWIGREAIDKNGKGIGKIADIYLDELSAAPEWIAVTTGLFGTRISFAPLKGAAEEGDEIKLAHEKATIKDSPNIEADGELSIEEEERLYRHYGMQYQPSEDSGATSVGTEITPAMARARLRKRDSNSVEFIDLDAESPISTDERR